MTKTALHAVGCAILCTALAYSADPPQKQSSTDGRDEHQVKKLGSVTWDLKSHRLVWTVQSGNLVNGKFVSVSEQQYAVSPDEAVMSFMDEKRGFAEAEANSLQHLLDILTVYCAESVVWWDQGEGTPVDGTATPKNSGDRDREEAVPEQKPVRVKEQAPVKTVPVALRLATTH
jgi:hypothetical protein